MIKKYTKSFVFLIAVNCIAFLLHTYFINNSVNSGATTVLNLNLSYLINAAASLGVCLGILFLKKQFEEYIGFVFLGLSVFKMIIVFILLNPTNEMGHVEKIDALAFFIPFGLNLVMELIFIVKLLKISDLAEELKNK